MARTDRTLLEELIRRRAGEAVTGMLGAAAMQVAEDLAKEALADEEFRAAFRAMVRRHAQQMLEALQEPPAQRRPRGNEHRPRKRAR